MDEQVTADVQWSTGLQTSQESAGPSWRKYPDWQVVHCGFVASRQPALTEQWAIAGHVAHTVAGFVLSGYWPNTHALHRELVAAVHVSGEVQPETAVHGRHTLGTTELSR